MVHTALAWLEALVRHSVWRHSAMNCWPQNWMQSTVENRCRMLIPIVSSFGLRISKTFALGSRKRHTLPCFWRAWFSDGGPCWCDCSSTGRSWPTVPGWVRNHLQDPSKHVLVESGWSIGFFGLFYFSNKLCPGRVVWGHKQHHDESFLKVHVLCNSWQMTSKISNDSASGPFWCFSIGASVPKIGCTFCSAPFVVFWSVQCVCFRPVQSRAWTLKKSLTRPSVLLYFREIRKKWCHWPGGQWGCTMAIISAHMPGRHMWASAGQGQSSSSPKQWKSDSCAKIYNSVSARLPLTKSKINK